MEQNAGEADKAQAIRFDEGGIGYCPKCGKLLGFRDECGGMTLFFAGGLWVEWGARLHCANKKCFALLQYCASDRKPEELAERIRNRCKQADDKLVDILARRAKQNE